MIFDDDDAKKNNFVVQGSDTGRLEMVSDGKGGTMMRLDGKDIQLDPGMEKLDLAKPWPYPSSSRMDTLAGNLELYIKEELGGACSVHSLPCEGFSLGIWDISEKMLRGVIIPHIECEAERFDCAVKLDEGRITTKDGHVHWAEVIIA